MKIIKYQKDKRNKYKVFLETGEITLYDDCIVKFNLLMKHNITDKEYQSIVAYNTKLDSYYMAIKYINSRLRSKKELRDYLIKKGIGDDVINKTITKLEETGYLNDEMFLKSYINDKVKLGKCGKKKITSDLIKHGFSEEKVMEYLSDIDESVWVDKIKEYCDKKIKNNHKDSTYVIVSKLKRDLVNLGFDAYEVSTYLNSIEIDEDEILKTQARKIKKNLENKYSGYELENKIKAKLYNKGFYVNDIKEYLDEE